MKVLQIIDSLNPGGAEHMAVSYANLLQNNGIESHICVTRQEGLLKESINDLVLYKFLGKKSSLDLNAILALRNYIKKYDINILHAHSTSYFLSTILKIVCPSVRLIWHDHYGNSEFLNKRKKGVLKYCSKHFDGIISVNSKLKNWSLDNLNCKNVIKVNNFIGSNTQDSISSKLKGNPSAFKIICVANLRPQKDHENLISAFKMLMHNYDISLHLIGNNPQTNYSNRILQNINDPMFKNKIFYYGSQKNVLSYLMLSDLGVLSSLSEGLPLALLEYGISGLPVVATNVGNCEELLLGNGKLVPPGDSNMLAKMIHFYYENEIERALDAKNLKRKVQTHYSKESIAKEVISFYSELLNYQY